MNPWLLSIGIIIYIAFLTVLSRWVATMAHRSGKIEGKYEIMEKLSDEGRILILDSNSSEPSHCHEYYHGGIDVVNKVIMEDLINSGTMKIIEIKDGKHR